jgi:protein-tyrosine phosphatase
VSWSHGFFGPVAWQALPWKASSKGLALERGVNNIGPMAVSAINALEAMGLNAADDFARSPAQVTMDDLEQADWIVALKHDEHLPLLQERFPGAAPTVHQGKVYALGATGHLCCLDAATGKVIWLCQ